MCCSPYHWGESNPAHLLNLQALVVVGGRGFDNIVSSVVTLLPEATAWTPLASLPFALWHAKASIVGGRIRVTGGWDESSQVSEVEIEK